MIDYFQTSTVPTNLRYKLETASKEFACAFVQDQVARALRDKHPSIAASQAVAASEYVKVEAHNKLTMAVAAIVGFVA